MCIRYLALDIRVRLGYPGRDRYSRRSCKGQDVAVIHLQHLAIDVYLSGRLHHLSVCCRSQRARILYLVEEAFDDFPRSAGDAPVVLAQRDRSVPEATREF
jgi:hypothetical protein